MTAARAPSTVRDYRNTAHRHLIPRFGDRPLSAITVDDLERLRAELLDELSPRTAQKTLVLLPASSGSPMRRGWRQQPVAEAERITVKRRRRVRGLVPAEVQAVARAPGPSRTPR